MTRDINEGYARKFMDSSDSLLARSTLSCYVTICAEKDTKCFTYLMTARTSKSGNNLTPQSNALFQINSFVAHDDHNNATTFFLLCATYMHIQSINFGENPTDRAITTTDEYAKRIEMSKQPKA